LAWRIFVPTVKTASVRFHPNWRATGTNVNGADSLTSAIGHGMMNSAQSFLAHHFDNREGKVEALIYLVVASASILNC
jgi:hypothetical protein